MIFSNLLFHNNSIAPRRRREKKSFVLISVIVRVQIHENEGCQTGILSPYLGRYGQFCAAGEKNRVEIRFLKGKWRQFCAAGDFFEVTIGFLKIWVFPP